MFSAQQTTSAATRPRQSAAVVSSLPSAANSLAASRGAVCGPFFRRGVLHASIFFHTH